MSEQGASTSLGQDLGSADYGASYYLNYWGGGGPYERNERWLKFFDHVADGIVRDLHPISALDAGCAMGFLVEALRKRGVDASGVDISEYAISQVDPSVAEHCRVGSVTEPLGGRYDLIACIEVLEHIPPAETDAAIANLCGATDRLLVSSTPGDYGEPTHLNVQPPETWSAKLAQHGFMRDLDLDLSYISPWAALYTRRQEPLADTVRQLRPVLVAVAPRGDRGAGVAVGVPGQARGARRRGRARQPSRAAGGAGQAPGRNPQAARPADRQGGGTGSDEGPPRRPGRSVDAACGREIQTRIRDSPARDADRRRAAGAARPTLKPRATVPLFSILTPVYETPANVLEKMLRSARRQAFGDWELCLVDDGSKQPHVREILDRAERQDRRIRVRHRPSNDGIVAASNEALAMAQGEFIALLDHDDLLHPDALAHVAEAIAANPEVDYVYTDEDKVDPAGHHSTPFFKPDWSPERMRTQMFTCHLSVMRRSLVEEVGGFDPEFEGSQDWDLVLKVTERARAVVHVPRILYHWRMLESSAAGGGEAAKPWAFEAGKGAVQAHCDRIGLQATVERDPDDPGVLHLEPKIEREPLVSIIIPTAGQVRDVRFEPKVLVVNCVRSIVERSTYRNFEIVCVVHASVPPIVLQELRDIGGERLRLVPYDAPFNFSAKINLGAVNSRGEHLLLLNDDIEISTPNWLERMVMYSEHEGIGAVGGRLIWGDGRLQHVGVDFDYGLPGHTYRGFGGDFKGYAQRRSDRPQLPCRDRRLPDDSARGLRGARRPHCDVPGQLQRRRLLPQGTRERPSHRLRPRPAPVPLRVLEPPAGGRGMGEGTAGRTVAAPGGGGPVRQPEPKPRPAPADLLRLLGPAQAEGAEADQAERGENGGKRRVGASRQRVERRHVQNQAQQQHRARPGRAAKRGKVARSPAIGAGDAESRQQIAGDVEHGAVLVVAEDQQAPDERAKREDGEAVDREPPLGGAAPARGRTPSPPAPPAAAPVTATGRRRAASGSCVRLRRARSREPRPRPHRRPARRRSW